MNVAALQRITRSVPIVFASVIDPVGAGFVASLARPGGNTTGFSAFEYSLSGKWLELLKEIAPNVTRAAVLRDPALAAGIGQFAAIQAMAPPSFGVELTPIDVRDPSEIERAITAFAREPNGGLIVTASQSAVTHRKLIISLASRYRLPNVYPFRYYPASGGLASYGPDPIDVHKRAAGLRRSHPQRREARRTASASAYQVRAGDQSQDRQGARPRPCHRRCSPPQAGPRMNGAMSSIGPSRHVAAVADGRFRGKADFGVVPPSAL